MPLETWQEQLRRGSLDLAILLTVSAGPRYGLAIIQHLEAFTDLIVTEGTIYPILGRLTRDGLLDSYWVEDEAPHPRKYYRLTRQVARCLTDMKSKCSLQVVRTAAKVQCRSEVSASDICANGSPRVASRTSSSVSAALNESASNCH